ncbi:cytochrome B [Bradyrhizobium forestalis]|uniref:Cytochrome B n=1 Tax=Bradyrhizobium forestalis TaxID=1419263 RepID=A0A2M8R4S6_9BRAD|nr:cytochrome b/b6 domain-containing protein [Bradyrhizobium forestalis]PJG52820.1 cytochrome B [Bradyrhizobium forestalis]
MRLKSTPKRYGAMIVAMHWLTALLMVALIATGFRAGNTVDPAAKAAILRIHIPIAIAVLALTVLRIGWWWSVDRRPDPIAESSYWQERTARAVHLLFYLLIIGLIASGIGMMALSGAAPMIFGGNSASLPDFWKYPPRVPHGLGARLLLVLVALHVGAALYHQFVRRDHLLRRMWFGR